MSNLDTLGVTAAALQRRINPRFIADGPHVAPYGTFSVGSWSTPASTVTFAGVDFPPDGLIGLRIEANGVSLGITDNTGDTVTVDGDPADFVFGSSGTATIVGHPLFWSEDEFQAELALAAAEVRSAVTAAYHRLMRRIVGEVAVSYATSGQTEFALAYAPSGNVELLIAVPRQPYLASAENLSLPGWLQSHVLGSDLPPTYDYTRLTPEQYSIAARTVTLTSGLTHGARIIASYDHDFEGDGGESLVPKVLTGWTLNLLAHSFHLTRSGDGEVSQAAQQLYDQTQAALARLRDPGDPAGIDEFDAIAFVDAMETRVQPVKGATKMLVFY